MSRNRRIARRGRVRKGSVSINSVQTDPMLTAISVHHAASYEGYVHDKVFPIVPVEEMHGDYFVFSQSDLRRLAAQRRAPGTEYQRKTFGLSTRPFRCEQWALAYGLPEEVKASRGSPLGNDEHGVEFLTDDLVTTRELEWHNAYMQTGVWASDVAGTTDFVKFDNAAATIVKTLKARLRAFKLRCRMKATHMVIAGDVWDVICDADELVSRLQNTSSDPVDPAWFASIIGVPKIIIADADYNDAAEGAADNFIDMCSEKIGIFHAPPNPSILTPSAGYTFSWATFDQVRVDGGGAAIKKYFDESTDEEVFKGKSYYDFGVVAPSAGELMTDVIT